MHGNRPFLAFSRLLGISALALLLPLSACKDSSDPLYGSSSGTKDPLSKWWGTWDGIHAGVWFGEEVLTEPFTLILGPCDNGQGVAIRTSLSWGFVVPGLTDTGNMQVEGCSSRTAEATTATLTDLTFLVEVRRGNLLWTFLGTHFGTEILGDMLLNEVEADGSIQRLGASDFRVAKPTTN